MKQIIILFSILTALFSSCTFEEDYSFNADWSGEYSAVLDLSGLADMGDASSEDDLIPADEIKSMEDDLNGIEGISNTKVEPDNENHKIKFSFNFDDLESLNRLNTSDFGEGDSPLEALGKWEMKNKGKKKFYMTMIGLEKLSSESSDDSEEAKRAGEMLTVVTTLTFPSKIKNLTSDVAVKGDKNNQIIINYSGKDMMEKGKNWNIEVKL